MVNILEDGDRINLSPTDVRALLALLLGPMSGYEAARQCEKDAGGDYRLSNSSIYGPLKSLEECSFIEVIESNATTRPGKKSQVYRITGAGKGALEDRLRILAKTIRTGRERGLKF